MKIVDAGHSYILESLNNSTLLQELHFIKHEGPNFPFNYGTQEGTNVQEVLRALIDRTEYLNRQKPCAETESAAALLRAALLLFELRAARRHDRHLALGSTQPLMFEQPCTKCGHIGCTGNHK